MLKPFGTKIDVQSAHVNILHFDYTYQLCQAA